MENNRAIYKRVKINWWIIFLLVGINGSICIDMIFAYIHQRGNNPIPNIKVLIILEIPLLLITIFTLIFLSRFKVIIDDDYVVFRSDVWIPVKIPIFMIDNVIVKQVPKMSIDMQRRNHKTYQFDYFVTNAVIIRTKSEKTYKIIIKDAEKIKEEIEKRMIR